jgi:hypothetical protein
MTRSLEGEECYKQYTRVLIIDTEMTCYKQYTGIFKIDTEMCKSAYLHL